MMKKAFITGITGQDGNYLTNLLLKNNYEVYGTCRNLEGSKYLNFKNEFPNVEVFECDISNFKLIKNLITKIQPNEIYNLAAQSVSVTSLNLQKETFDVNAGGVLNILESIRSINTKIKFLQASSCEVFGKEPSEFPQNEKTPYNPQTPYAAAKSYSDYLIRIYRNQLSIFACSTILFNHESPKRGPAYVTKKITESAANISKGNQEKLYLGNLDAKRDWGHAKDYVECMWLILQAKKPDDYVIATGEMHTVREFCQIAFQKVGINLKWEGSGINEKGIDKKTGKTLIEVDSQFFRPKDLGNLCGNNEKVKYKINWQPKTSFENIVEEMTESELK